MTYAEDLHKETSIIWNLEKSENYVKWKSFTVPRICISEDPNLKYLC